ncbi:MAG TPA: hypothetical protein VFC73_02620, partial [Syntrophomonadaceae bacterium]|nr:hypothetical protein [Syntrophomonadaceae bacterium]
MLFSNIVNGQYVNLPAISKVRGQREGRINFKMKKAEILISAKVLKNGARGRNRTGTTGKGRGILSP